MVRVQEWRNDVIKYKVIPGTNINISTLMPCSKIKNQRRVQDDNDDDDDDCSSAADSSTSHDQTEVSS